MARIAGGCEVAAGRSGGHSVALRRAGPVLAAGYRLRLSAAWAMPCSVQLRSPASSLAAWPREKTMTRSQICSSSAAEEDNTTIAAPRSAASRRMV